MSEEPIYGLEYLLEKFDDAIYDLATGVGDLRDRVCVAYLRFWHIQLSDYPEKVREEVERILQAMTSQQGSSLHESSIQSNLRQMEDQTVSQIAERILRVYRELLKLQGSSQ